MRTSALTRKQALGVLFGASFLSAGAAAESPVTVMDPVFVEASPAPSGGLADRPWSFGTVPGFEILSRCPHGFTAAYAQALRRAEAARLALLPAAFWGELPTPIKVVLYDRPPERMGLSLGSPIDLSWIAEDSAVLGSDNVELSHPLTLGDGDTFINCGNYWDIVRESDGFSVDVDSSIRIENRVPHFPAWFMAGLQGPCGLYANHTVRSTLRGDVLVLPNALWISSAKTLAIRRRAHRAPGDKDGPFRENLLPLDALFRGSEPDEQRGLWNAEAALLVRWGLFRSGNRAGFLGFVDDATREPITEPLFRTHLGLSYGEALKLLGDYLSDAVGETLEVPIPEAPERPVDFREASQAEIARIIGDWGRLEARSSPGVSAAYRRDCLEQADRLYERISARREHDPLFLAAFGLYELQAEDALRAREALRAATDAGVIRPRAYVELARLRLEESLPSAQEGIGDLSEEEYGEITALLRTARLQMPSLRTSYSVLLRALEHAPSRPSLEDLEPLAEGTRSFPQDATLAYTVATLYKRLGYRDEAVALVRRALSFAESEGARRLLSEELDRYAAQPGASLPAGK
jgi:tetratricopeptide (TPR) repeat protein